MSSLNSNKIKGNFGEKLACRYLSDQGYSIIETNFKNRIGEVDIIANKKSIIIFVEVKSRSNINYGYPFEAVNKKKQDKLRKLAQSYISLHTLIDTQFRFDIIEVYLKEGKVNHIENAF